MNAPTINLKPSTVYPTSDGQTFPTRDEAVAHEKYLLRRKALASLAPDAEGDDGVVSLDWLASNGDAVAQALAVKMNRGGGGRKKAAEAAAA